MEIYIDDRVLLQMTEWTHGVFWLGRELSFPLGSYPVSGVTSEKKASVGLTKGY